MNIMLCIDDFECLIDPVGIYLYFCFVESSNEMLEVVYEPFCFLSIGALSLNFMPSVNKRLNPMPVCFQFTQVVLIDGLLIIKFHTLMYLAFNNFA